jgi:hypothetical protein
VSASISSTTGNVSGMLDALFKSVDKNGDKQVSADEFRGQTATTSESMTAPMLSGISQVSSLATAATSTTATTAAAAGGYAPIQGFDFRKLSDTTHQTDKYSPAVRAFSQALYALKPDAAASRDHLAPIVDYVKQLGFPNATAVGDDKIDFGDGVGPIDVITSSNQWWFGQPF